MYILTKYMLLKMMDLLKYQPGLIDYNYNPWIIIHIWDNTSLPSKNENFKEGNGASTEKIKT